ncbi:MAG: hypothetical protein LBR65_02245 [Culturomica sp.]|jgi:hypothetical protein|nr:hypothetical protein [Culturomica sp.]
MKKFLVLLGFVGLIACSSLSAQNNDSVQAIDRTEQATDSPAVDSTAEKTGTVSGFFSDMANALVAMVFGLLLFVGPLAMIGHMLYVNWKTRMLEKPLNVEHFIDKRTRKGVPGAMNDDEVELGFRLLDEAYNELTSVETDESGNEFHKPGTMKELLRAQKKIDEVGKLMPTDAALLERYNEYRSFLYDYLRRSFFASWKLIILCVLVAVGVAFMESGSFWKGFFTVGAFFWFPAIVYYISSQVPQYMIDRKNERGGGKGWFSTALVALGLGVLGSGYTVRTKWSDGSVTEDNSSHLIALFLGLLVLIAVAATIYIWAIVNYLRNYVLYW